MHKLLKRLGNGPLVITMIAENYLGDKHAMLRFRQKGEQLIPDWTIVETVLDHYLSEVGKPNPLIFHLWTQVLFGVKTKHAPGNMPAPEEVLVPVTVINDDGSLETRKIKPPYLEGNDAIWRKIFVEFENILEKRGVSKDRVVLGSAADGRPRKHTVDFFSSIGYNSWQCLSHGRGMVIPKGEETELILDTGLKIDYNEIVYCGGVTPREDGILGGWNVKYKTYTILRNFLLGHDPLKQYRGIYDITIVSGKIPEKGLQLKELHATPYDQFARGILEKAFTTSGMTRLPLLPNRENYHQRDKTLRATFPGVIRGNPGFLTTIDKNKLVMTGRFLQFYEGKIESEARMLIEKSILSGKLPKPMEDKFRQFLAKRTLIISRDEKFTAAAGLGYGQGYDSRYVGIADDWQIITKELFEIAGEIQLMK